MPNQMESRIINLLEKEEHLDYSDIVDATGMKYDTTRKYLIDMAKKGLIEMIPYKANKFPPLKKAEIKDNLIWSCYYAFKKE